MENGDNSNTLLKEYFPMLRDREELLNEIHNTWKYQQTFIKWTEEQQDNFFLPLLILHLKSDIL